MKLKGLVGKGRGKLGNAVFVVNSGVQIVRQYQPNVNDPCTSPQVHRRAVFKAIAQLSADLLPYIAIPWLRRISPRNQFEQINYELVNYQDGIASIDLTTIQLTRSSLGLSEFVAYRSDGRSIRVSLLSSNSINVDKVVYIALTRSEDGHLNYWDSVVCSDPGDAGSFEAHLKYTLQSIVIYAYGVRIDNNKSRAGFGNMATENGERLAQLVVASHNVSSGTTLTVTKGLAMVYDQPYGWSGGGPAPFVQISAEVQPPQAGTVRGVGSYQLGSMATLLFEDDPNDNVYFDGWFQNGLRVITQLQFSFPVFEPHHFVVKCEPAFRNMMVNGVPFDHDILIPDSIAVVTALCPVSLDGKIAFLWYKATPNPPRPGNKTQTTYAGVEIQSGHYNFSKEATLDDVYWYPVIGHYDEEGHIIVEIVYPYYVRFV